MELDELLKNPHARKRLELIKKSARATKNFTNEELLLKGIQLLAFSKSTLFKLDES